MSNTTATVTVTWGAGRNVLYAGTPLSSSGEIANNGDAYGILSHDLHMPDRSATVITAGEWVEDPGCGIVLSDACKKKLASITFTPPLIEYVRKTDLATAEAAGLVKMAEAVADAEDAPTAAEFNALLSSLRAAGIMAEPEEDPAEE